MDECFEGRLNKTQLAEAKNNMLAMLREMAIDMRQEETQTVPVDLVYRGVVETYRGVKAETQSALAARGVAKKGTITCSDDFYGLKEFRVIAACFQLPDKDADGVFAKYATNQENAESRTLAKRISLEAIVSHMFRNAIPLVKS